jgi:glycosyltransferase involved in cell wall biosynthesis
VRILIVNKYAYVTGGADRHCLELARALRSAGHDVAFLSTASDRNLDNRGRFVRLSVTHFSREALPAREQAAVAARTFWNPEAAAAMRDLLDSFRPAVVHAHKLYPQLSVAPLVVAVRRKVPIVQTLHDYELMAASSIDHRGRWRDRSESRFAFRFLNSATYPIRRWVHRRCITVSIAVSRYVARCYAAHGMSTTTIPNFTDEVDSGGAISFADRSGVAFVGRLTPEKGILDLLGLASLVPDIRITVVGEGPLRDAVEERSRRLPNLFFAGHKTPLETRSLLEASRVLVVPSKWEEPAPLVGLEAMAVGTPLVAYPRGGLAEYVDDAGAGEVVEESVPALARACASLHEDSARWETLSGRGRQAVARTHSPEEYVRRVTEVYEAARSIVRRVAAPEQ